MFMVVKLRVACVHARAHIPYTWNLAIPLRHKSELYDQIQIRKRSIYELHL